MAIIAKTINNTVAERHKRHERELGHAEQGEEQAQQDM